MIRTNYDGFFFWRRDAKEDGCSVRKITVSNNNTYYQAIHKEDGVRGFFNTGVGKNGEKGRSHGQLSRPRGITWQFT